MKQYTDLIKDILDNGIDRTDRTGTGTRSVFGRMLRFDLRDGFPLVTTKKVPLRLPAEEMLWFLKGDCNNKDLQAKNIHIWDEWADPETGDLGPIYGVQWRKWRNFDGWYIPGEYTADEAWENEPIDQVAELIQNIKNDPTSRRLIVEGWNVSELSAMALPPCHKSHQMYVDTNNKTLSMMLYQRSSDVGLGLPFNIAQYALLLHMYSHVTGLTPHELVITIGDAHIYHNHIEQLTEQSTREPFPLPTLNITRQITDIDDFKWEDFELLNYQHHPHIKLDVSV